MGNQPLLPLVEKFFENDPVRASHTLETLDDDEAVQVLQTLPTSLAAEAFRILNDPLAAKLLEKLPIDLFIDIVEKLDAEKAASLLLEIAPDKRDFFLGCMDEKMKAKIQELLSYPEDSAARVMTTRFIAFHEDVKVKDAIEKIRQMAKKDSAASYTYVVDQEHKLIGVMNMRDVILADPNAMLRDVMRREIFSIDGFMDRERVAQELSKRRFFAAPVVDPQGRLIGVIKAEQLLDDVQEEAAEDIQRMFGAGGDERTFSSVIFSLKKRLPWLHVNLATAFLAASVVALFEDTIAKITVLAVYLPVVAGQGGNAGAQSLAVVMRGLVMREIPAGRVKGLIFKETLVGLINGLVIGLVTALAAWLWQGNPYLGIVIGLGMIVNLTVAGFAGAAIPITMKAIRLDPAQCSNIILTTVTDVMGFFAFLGFAVLFQQWLV